MANPPHVFRPSSARLLLLDDFLPVPRGAAVTAPPALSWPAKDPADVLDYQLDIAPALIGNEGDAIARLDIAITPNGSGDLALISTAADGASAVLWLGGGQAGTIYGLAVTVITTNGRTIARTIRLPVLALSAPLPGDTALDTEAGLGLTDETGAPLTLLS